MVSEDPWLWIVIISKWRLPEKEVTNATAYN